MGRANSASRASSSPSKRTPATFWQTPQASGGTSLNWKEKKQLFFFDAKMGPVLTAAIDLNGTWSCNDHGTYTIHQEGRKISWNGENPPWFRNSFDASITEQGYVEGTWHDLPGCRAFSSGTLTLKIENPSRLVRISQTGNFSGSIWTKNGNAMRKSQWQGNTSLIPDTPPFQDNTKRFTWNSSRRDL